MAHIGKLFERYDVEFPVENTLSVIHGTNGTGKTKTLELLKEYFEEKGENVIYFEADRNFTVKEEDVKALMMTNILLEENDPFTKCGIKLEKLHFFDQYGEHITSGFMQLINLFCNIYFAEKDSIIIIDNIERSLHISIQRIIIDVLLDIKKVKKLIVVTYSPSIVAECSKDEVVDIKNCVKIGR